MTDSMYNESIALERKWMNRDWCRQTLDPYHYRFLELTIPIMKQLYGENWDLELIFEQELNRTETNSFGFTYNIPGGRKLLSINFVIHFPQFTITNSLDQAHIIRDLFIRSEFLTRNNNTLDLIDLKGIRTTITDKEYQSGYSHSHLYTKNFNNEESRKDADEFCLGRATGMANTQTMLKAELSEPSEMQAPNYNIDPNMFKLYMMQIKTYAIWESIEGGPYQTINNIAMKRYIDENLSLAILDTSVLGKAFETYYSFYNSNNLPPINWKLEGDKYVIINDDTFASGFIPGNSANIEHFFYKDSSGNYYTDGNFIIDAQAMRIETPLFIYKGEYKHFKVITTTSNEEVNRPIFIHPKIISYVKQQLEQRANKAALIRSYNK